MRKSGCGNYIALLSAKEALSMHDAKSGKTLWSINFKLRDFIDITLATDVIFLLTKKFALSIVKGGKVWRMIRCTLGVKIFQEVDQVNVHDEAVGFDNAPANCVANEKYVQIGTANGKLLIVYEATEKTIRKEVVEAYVETAVTKVKTDSRYS